MKKLALLLLFAAPAFAQVNVQGTGIQLGGSTSTGGVTSLKTTGNPALTGDITFACGTGLSCSQSGNTITINTAAALSITTFTGGQTVEVGTSVFNPTFAAAYSTTPASAQITNTEGIGSPLILSSPFNVGTVSGTFSHATPTVTTFTLSATLGATVTAPQTISWQYSIFGGVGASGATSSVTASGTTAVLSTGDALARIQIGEETVEQSLGSYTPHGQNIYLLLRGGSHTFIDACTGFPFAFDAPIAVSFVNAHGTTVSMWLYASTNPLYYVSGCAYTPKVAS